MSPRSVGRRIIVWGVSGSGKTTFTRGLADVLGVPAIQLDALFWKPGWLETSDDELRDKLRAAVEGAPDGWIIDGSYWRVSSAYLDQTDAVIWLRLPWRVCFSRLLWRTLFHVMTGKPFYYEGGPRESWRQAFFSRASILWLSIRDYRRSTAVLEQRVTALPGQTRIYELRSPREVDAFLKGWANYTSRRTEIRHYRR